MCVSNEKMRSTMALLIGRAQWCDASWPSAGDTTSRLRQKAAVSAEDLHVDPAVQA
jgi:hypothetical protein